MCLCVWAAVYPVPSIVLGIRMIDRRSVPVQPGLGKTHHIFFNFVFEWSNQSGQGIFLRVFAVQFSFDEIKFFFLVIWPLNDFLCVFPQLNKNILGRQTKRLSTKRLVLTHKKTSLQPPIQYRPFQYSLPEYSGHCSTVRNIGTVCCRRHLFCPS